MTAIERRVLLFKTYCMFLTALVSAFISIRMKMALFQLVFCKGFNSSVSLTMDLP